jgi:hypothetical protein
MKRMYTALAAVLIAATLLVSLAGALDAQGIRQQFEHVIARALTVNGAAILNGAATANGATTINGALTANADADFAAAATLTTARLRAATPISVTQGATITPTASYQPLQSAGNVSTAAIATGSAGDLLILINAADTTITISDTGTLKLSGNIALGQFDALTLISDGTNWTQIATSNN